MRKLKGRMFNVVGEAEKNQPGNQPAHALPSAQQSTNKTEISETGIKVVDFDCATLLRVENICLLCWCR